MIKVYIKLPVHVKNTRVKYKQVNILLWGIKLTNYCWMNNIILETFEPIVQYIAYHSWEYKLSKIKKYMYLQIILCIYVASVGLHGFTATH